MFICRFKWLFANLQSYQKSLNCVCFINAKKIFLIMPVSIHTTATRTGQGVGQVQARGHRAAGTDCKYKF